MIFWRGWSSWLSCRIHATLLEPCLAARCFKKCLPGFLQAALVVPIIAKIANIFAFPAVHGGGPAFITPPVHDAGVAGAEDGEEFCICTGQMILAFIILASAVFDILFPLAFTGVVVLEPKQYCREFGRGGLPGRVHYVMTDFSRSVFADRGRRVPYFRSLAQFIWWLQESAVLLTCCANR